jgi:mRNA interferase RelE/StbE
MKIAFKASFAKDLRRVGNKQILGQVQEAIQNTESAHSLSQLPNLKKLRVEGRYYRMRIGDYRVGLIIENDIVTFVRFLHRSDIYRYFP